MLIKQETFNDYEEVYELMQKNLQQQNTLIENEKSEIDYKTVH